MALFANNWINIDLKHEANNVIIQRNFGKIVEQPIIPAQIPVNKHLKSAYFRDMISLDKHMKASYSKEGFSGKHKKSSYVKEFVKD
jgi:hypothetical protein